MKVDRCKCLTQFIFHIFCTYSTAAPGSSTRRMQFSVPEMDEITESLSIKVLNCLTVCVTVHQRQRQSVFTALRQFSVAETVGVTVFQSVLTAVRQFWVPKMVGVTVYQSVLTVGRQFLVPETVGVTAYQSVLSAVGSFRFLRWAHCRSKCLNCR